MLLSYFDDSSPNPQEWKLKEGAPEIMAAKFTEIVSYLMPSDNQDLSV